MPFYTYKCKDCKKELTLKLSVNDTKPTECSECNGILDRDYSSVRCDLNVEKRDPNHTNYWKKDMSVSQIASVIENKKQPY